MTRPEDLQQHEDLHSWLTNPFGAANVRGTRIALVRLLELHWPTVDGEAISSGSWLCAHSRKPWPCGTFKVMAAELERPVDLDELAAAISRHPAGKRR